MSTPPSPVTTKSSKIKCYGRSKCNAGYQSKIPPNQIKTWACGKNCPGGMYMTDGACNCACVPTLIVNKNTIVNK